MRLFFMEESFFQVISIMMTQMTESVPNPSVETWNTKLGLSQISPFNKRKHFTVIAMDLVDQVLMQYSSKEYFDIDLYYKVST